MSIEQFTASLRNAANASFRAEASDLLDRFVQSASSAFSSGPMKKAASVLSQGKIRRTDSKGNLKDYSLADKFRDLGAAQGRTRLILTEDDIQDIFNNLNVSSNSIKPIALYAKFLAVNFPKKAAAHYEIYLSNGTVLENSRQTLAELLESVDLNLIIAIRGLNFSHRNTVEHVAHFIHYLNVMPGMGRKDIEKLITGSYDRGHVYAQTTGRALISAADIIGEENILSEIVKLYTLMDEGSSSLNRLDGKYNELLARSKKDFTGNRIFMNIQLQLKRDAEGVGNRDTGELSAYIQIVGLLQNLIAGSKLSADGKRQLGAPAAESLKQFEATLTNFAQKLDKYQDKLNKVLGKTSQPDYLIKLRTSDSIIDFIGANVKSVISTGKSAERISVKTPNISVAKSDRFTSKLAKPSSKVASSLAKVKNDLVKLKSQLSAKKSINTQAFKATTSSSLASLQVLLDAQLQHVVAANMGNGTSKNTLNYRTGRLAASAKVERLSQSREGMITAFYSYMRNPYATFSDGGRQEYPKSRDPKLLISQSIKEIMATKVSNRMRAVLV